VDRIGDWDVLVHALHEVERQDRREYDVIVMLQPTCPLRRPEHVTATVEKLVGEGWDAAWTVSRSELRFRPLKALTLEANGELDYFDPGGTAILARQQLKPVYYRNGAAYAITRDCLLYQQTIKAARTSAAVVDSPLVNIDGPPELELVERPAAEMLDR
jgi:CMP-N,N'-diacetyllegionaminic acid synthase